MMGIPRGNMTRIVRMCAGIAVMAFAIVGSPLDAAAQDAKHFVYFAPGNQTDRGSKSQVYAAGVGFERTLEEHLAIQVDVAALSHFDVEASRTLGGIASFDAVGNVWVGRRLELLGVAGYSLAFGDDTINLGNFGGGLRHWFREDRAVLLEFRRHQGDEAAWLNKFWTVRIGLVFR
jgi:hypothetical protein